MVMYRGGCHCGAIRYEVDAPKDLDITECNCSVCSKSGYLHLIVPQGRFRLLHGEEHLQTYTFNTGTARHLFCKTCGIKSFYIPRSHPDGISVNARCLDDIDIEHIRITRFDGRNWEKSIHQLTDSE